MKYFILTIIAFTSLSCYSQTTYTFDKNAGTYCCTNVYFQKISKDLRYELMIEVKLDSIPKLQEIDITKYPKFITIYINKYEINNPNIYEICDDAPYYYKDAKPPTTFKAISGKFIISSISTKDHIISANIKNVILVDKSNNKIKLPSENFVNLFYGWMGG